MSYSLRRLFMVTATFAVVAAGLAWVWHQYMAALGDMMVAYDEAVSAEEPRDLVEK